MVGHVLDVPTNLPLRLLASDRALLPAGPFRYKNVYHFFMQHACGGGPTAARVDAACKRMGWPESRPGGPSTSTGVGWGHLTSTDGAHWTEQPVALAPPFVDIGAKKTQAEQGYAGFDVTGYFTGSAQLVNGEPRILFPAVFRAPNITAEFPNCMAGNVPGRQNVDCFFDIQLAVPKNLSDPWLKDWVITGTPFSHDIKWKGQSHYFVWEDPDQAFRDPLNPNRWLLIHDTCKCSRSLCVFFRSSKQRLHSWRSEDRRPVARAAGDRGR